MYENDILTLNIEKLSNLGYGIAKIDGYVIFVEGTCPGDTVSARITKVNKNFANAKTLEVITPSPHRVVAFCAMQKVCGACQLQFIDYDYQLKLKRQIVADAMQNIANLNIEILQPIPSPDIKNYRHKIQCPIGETKVSKKMLAGYYKPQSHDIVNIKHCPIQPELCDRIIDYIRENSINYGISGFNEKTHTGYLRHVVIRSSSYSGNCLVTLVLNSTKISKNIKNFAQEIYNNFQDVVGVCVNLNPQKTNVILGKNTECICGQDFVEEKILDKTFKIGADTFFQVNPKSAENIFKYVKEKISQYENPTVLDAYAGIATFGIVVSDVAEKVVSVEENTASIKKAQEVLNENNIANVELYAQDTAKYLKSIKRKFDITILDPPRKGCTQESLNETLAHTKQKIIYVSCNPATLARDLRYLTEHGAKVESIQPFDMFCHTYHIENVAIISL